MAHQSLEKFMRRLRRVEREVKHLSSAPRLAYSSVEGGTLDFHDADGNLAITIGPQPDGTNAQVVASGPTPPNPAGTSGTPYFDGVVAKWDGTWENNGVAPLDFARVEIHASTDPDFLPDLVGAPSGTLVASFSSPRGGAYSVSLEYGVDWYLKFIARSQSGAYSDPTVAALGPFQTAVIPGSRVSADILEGKTVTGATMQTAADGERLVFRDDGSSGVIEAYSGVPGDFPTKINPLTNLGASGPGVSVETGFSATNPVKASLQMVSGPNLSPSSSGLLGGAYVLISAPGLAHLAVTRLRLSYSDNNPDTDDHLPIPVEGSLSFSDQLLQPGMARRRRSRGSAFATTSGTWNTVLWNVEDVNVGNTVEPMIPYNSGIFTLDPDGVYLVCTSVHFAANGTGSRRCRIASSGPGGDFIHAEDFRSAVTGSVGTAMTLSQVVTGFDDVRIDVYQDIAANLDVISPSNVFVTRIG
jgi:hypothetical protein